MFTGIVSAIGTIDRIEPRDRGMRLTIEAGALGLADVKLGDSIAVNGVCLTAVELATNHFAVDVSQETIDCTIGLGAPGSVNLEKSLTLADRLGGHLVSGHVDGVGDIVVFEPIGESWLLRIRAPEPLARYIARKGSVCVQGVSLTVNRVEGATFDINLIPHTIEVTTLKHLRTGGRVNLEVDMIARYVERMLGTDA